MKQTEKTIGKSFDRKVIHTRTSRLLSLSRIIPKNWQYVRITPIILRDEAVFIRIDKLIGDKLNAQTRTDDKRREPHT